MEEILDDFQSDQKFYKLWHIRIGTFLGGPIAGTYFIAQNFKSLKDTDKCKKTLIIGTASTIILLSLTVVFPFFEKIPSYIFPFVYILIAHQLYNSFQKEPIEISMQNGAQNFSVINTAIVTIVSFMITIAPVFLYYSFYDFR